MKALRALVSRGMSAVAGLLSGMNVSLAKPAEPHHTDRNQHCECWGCQRTRSTRRRSRPLRYSNTFGAPKLTGKRLERVTEACAAHHLTVLPVGFSARRYTGEQIAEALSA